MMPIMQNLPITFKQSESMNYLSLLRFQDYYIKTNGIMFTILSQRKRFNYNVGVPNNTRTNHSQKKLNLNSFIQSSHVKDENQYDANCIKVQDANKKILQLEAINRKIVEDATIQFKNVEQDVQRVQRILEEKEGQIFSLESQKKTLKESSNQMSEERKILIEAILEKDLIIKEFEEKLKQILKSRQLKEEKPVNKTQEIEAQTDPLGQTCFKSQLNAYASKNRELEDELYEVRQDLFDAQNKVKLITQQFQAYKLLKQIESVQDD